MASPARPFYSKFVWKDWHVKTLDLTAHEYTAYHRLLTYAATSSPDMCSIPADDRRLARVTGLGTRLWNRVKARVLEFWVGPHETTKMGLRYSNLRLREDAGNWFHLVEKQRRAACIRHSQTPPNSELEVRSKKESKKEPPNPPSPRTARRSDPEGFSEWYQAYPLHKARKAAEKAYRKAVREVSPEILLEGARRYAVEVRGREQDKIAHPATWLNQGRWLDEARPLQILSVIEADPLAHIRAEIERMEREKAQ